MGRSTMPNCSKKWSRQRRRRQIARPVRARNPKLPVLLITAEDELWPQVGADLSSNLVLKQLDSIDELINTFPAGQPGIILWDARNNADPASVLTRLSQHSTRFAIVALDSPTSASAWTLPLQHRQIVAHVPLPIAGGTLAKALDGAQEEVQARMALLGDGPSTSGPSVGDFGQEAACRSDRLASPALWSWRQPHFYLRAMAATTRPPQRRLHRPQPRPSPRARPRIPPRKRSMR